MNAETIISNTSLFANYIDVLNLPKTKFANYSISKMPSVNNKPTPHYSTYYEKNIINYKDGVDFTALRNGWIAEKNGPKFSPISTPNSTLKNNKSSNESANSKQEASNECANSKQEASNECANSKQEASNECANSKQEAEEQQEISKSLFPIRADDVIFTFLSKIQWCDIDDGIATQYAFRLLDNRSLNLLYNAMIPVANDLKRCINNQNGMLSEVGDEMSFNITFHILSKGYAFYNCVISDAGFATYLIHQYQPLYSAMRKKLKLSN